MRLAPPAGRRLRASALTVAVMVWLAACGHAGNDTRSATAGLPNVLQQLTANAWILNHADSSLPGVSPTPITIAFSSHGFLAGASPCGSYRARFTLDEQAIKIQSVSRPPRQCGVRMLPLARAYLMVLGSVNKVAPTGQDHLKLEGPGNTRLSYDRHPRIGLDG